jgi:glucokinase
MATDVKAAAQAEARWGALAGCDPAVYLNLGTGLAVAIVTGGQVLAGRHGAAGEIGYSLRGLADVGLAPASRISLEEMVSGQALQRRAGQDGHDLTAAEIFTAAEQNARLDALVSEFIDELAFHVVNLTIAIDPARIAAGGGMTRSWARIEPRLAQALRAGVPYPPELVVAHFPHEAPLLGAVALAVDAAGDASKSSVTNNPNAASSNGYYGTYFAKDAAPRPQGSSSPEPLQATSHPAELCIEGLGKNETA